jgi:hypothetical protein
MFIADIAASIPPWAWTLLATGVICSRAASYRYQKGLNKYKGPFIASFTNFWRLWQWLWNWDHPYFPDTVKPGYKDTLGTQNRILISRVILIAKNHVSFIFM